ncbi:MAG: cyclic nucleotide-binding domain-containing protein, partial [Verrucomicrobiota bacterium]
VQEQHSKDTSTFVLDIRRVGLTDSAAQQLLLQACADLKAAGKQLLIVDPAKLVDRTPFSSDIYDVLFANDIEIALERCEEQIIRNHVEAPIVSGLVPFHEFDVFRSLTSTELSEVEGLLEMEGFKSDTRIVKQGDEPHQIYFLAKGSVSICLSGDENGEKGPRVAAFGPGVCFGEIAVIDGSLRSADVWADDHSTCYTLSGENLAKLESDHGSIYAKVIKNFLLLNIERLRRFNQEIGSLKS